MTANYTSGNGFYGASSYAITKDNAEVLHINNLYGDTPKSISKEMREVASTNRTKKPVLHASFSFHRSEQLSNANAVKAVESALSNVGITSDNHQYAIVKHNDTDHPHYHVVINRVGLDQKLHNDYYLSNRLMASCDKVEQDMNLRRTEGRTAIWDNDAKLNFKIDTKEISKPKKVRHTKNEQELPIKTRLQNEYLFAKADANSLEDFKSRLEKRGISADIKTNKSGVYGLSFRYKEHAFKSSALGIKAKELNTAFENKIEQPKEVKFDRETYIKQETHRYQTLNKSFINDKSHYIKMVAEHKKALADYGEVNPYNVAEKYNLGEEPFLGDLRAITTAKEDIKTKFDRERESRVESYKTLMNTQEKKVPWFGGQDAKDFNADLHEKRETAKEQIQYMDEKKDFLIESALDRKIGEIKGGRISEMEKEKDSKRANVLAESRGKGIDLVDEMWKNRKEERGRDNERNISRGRGFGR